MSALFFNPSPERTLLILEALIDPELSLRTVADRHQTTITALWLARPAIADQLSLFHSVFADRTRLVATCNLTTALAGLLRLLERFIESDKHPDPTLTPDQRQRARESARRAAVTIVKLSNFRPAPLGTTRTPSYDGPHPHHPTPHQNASPNSPTPTLSPLKSETPNSASPPISPLKLEIASSPLPASPTPDPLSPQNLADLELLLSGPTTPHEHWP